MLPPRPRQWLIRQATRSRYSQLPPLPWRPARPPAIEGQPRIRVRHQGETLTAAVASATSPVQARQHNLAEVRRVLDAAQVRYFRVPHSRDERTVLAVPIADRERVLAALTGSPRMAGGYVRSRTHASRPQRVPLRDATIIEVFLPVINADRTMLLADAFACDVEFWTDTGDALMSPREPLVSPLVRHDSPVVLAPERDFGQFCSASDDGSRFPTRRELLLDGMDWVRFPIDAVYTWVDSSDLQWRQRMSAALAANDWATANPQAANASRYLSRDELRYSLRSLHYYAPWIRRIFLVTDAQVPAWLDVDHPAITVVDHREIFGEAGRLPTFNSHAIESRLHHIPGLAEHFLYLNDDVFFGRPQTPDRFFLPNGIAKFFPSTMPVEAGPALPDEPPIMSASKNNRTVIAEHFGRLLTHKMRHTPHPEQRSVLAEIEQQCAELVRSTAGHQFRHPDDISVPSSLQHYWAYLTGRAVPGHIHYLYTNLKDPMTPLRLMDLVRNRRPDVFCLNDTDADETAHDEHSALLADFLPAYFPFAAPFERVGVNESRQLAGWPPVPTDPPAPTQPIAARRPMGAGQPAQQPGGIPPEPRRTDAPVR